MKAPEEIIKLLERFEDNIDAYKSGKYNEAQVRQEFINFVFSVDSKGVISYTDKCKKIQ